MQGPTRFIDLHQTADIIKMMKIMHEIEDYLTYGKMMYMYVCMFVYSERIVF